MGTHPAVEQILVEDIPGEVGTVAADILGVAGILVAEDIHTVGLAEEDTDPAAVGSRTDKDSDQVADQIAAVAEDTVVAGTAAAEVVADSIASCVAWGHWPADW